MSKNTPTLNCRRLTVFVTLAIIFLQNWANMAFSIVSTCIMFGDFIIYCIAVREMRYGTYKCRYSFYYTGNCYYTSNSAGTALYCCLLALSAAEFAIALIVAICCCKYGRSGCCYGEARGVRLFFYL